MELFVRSVLTVFLVFGAIGICVSIMHKIKEIVKIRIKNDLE